jgi:toxin ParE1/3/4
MTPKPIILTERTQIDVDDALAYYLGEAGEAVALGFLDALEAAYRRIAGSPAAGSPRYAHELNLPGLRSRALTKYPYLILYIEQPDRILLWRVLHAQRDIPSWMSAD